MNDILTEIKEKCYGITRRLALAGDNDVNVTNFGKWFMTLDKKQQKHAAEVFAIFEKYCFGKISHEEAKSLYDNEVKKYAQTL